MRLTIGYPDAEAVTLGAFQRSGDAPAATLRRASGGGAVFVGPGTLWLQLALDLGALPADKLVNRHVRPLLKALTRVSNQPTNWFGRDWISMAHRPVGFVGFAHSAATASGVLEAIIAVDAPFSTARASFREKAPATIAELAGRAIDREVVLAAIVDAYAVDTTRVVPRAEAVQEDPPWAATREEAIGVVAAGPDATGRLRVGGELMASSDAVAKLEGALAGGADVGHAVDDAFTIGGATIFGVRSLASLRDVILAARR